ncbi:MAG: hypothetical protein KJ893_05445 [Candidatus Omnitrophica bacterium]|nr:hypothetical protein [Candidatus Omnitrophota bacterium]MBU4479030.1 hypothetical protein [Candidatus Omnitrophota bacterium]MCG2703050.1 hypothetical protein [Candidatus Omnitrophota bacterium]
MSEELKQQEQQESTEQPASAAAQPEAKKDAKPPKVEIPKNCGACKKPIHRIRYYRNMRFFCNKKCWENFKKEQAQKKAEAENQQA